MVTTEQHPAFLKWASEVLGCHFEPEHGCKVLTTLSGDGHILAVAVFHRFSETNCEMAIATNGTGHWLTRRGLATAFGYPFLQCGLLRVTTVVEDSNERSIRLNKHLGFHEEGLVRNWFGEGKNGVLFGMLKNECRWIR